MDKRKECPERSCHHPPSTLLTVSLIRPWWHHWWWNASEGVETCDVISYREEAGIFLVGFLCIDACIDFLSIKCTAFYIIKFTGYATLWYSPLIPTYLHGSIKDILDSGGMSNYEEPGDITSVTQSQDFCEHACLIFLCGGPHWGVEGSVNGWCWRFLSGHFFLLLILIANFHFIFEAGLVMPYMD